MTMSSRLKVECIEWRSRPTRRRARKFRFIRKIGGKRRMVIEMWS
jgi:hypothetical protein